MTSIPVIVVGEDWTGDQSAMPVLPDVSADSMLTNGSLVLVDPSDDAWPWSPGAPAPGSIIPNLAWDRAAELLGTGDAEDFGLPWNNTLSGVEAEFERSAKGGLHGIVSQTNAGTSSDAAFLSLPTSIRDYLFAHQTHALFISLWGSVTRLTTATQDPLATIYNSSPTTNFLTFMEAVSGSSAAIRPVIGTGFVGQRLTGGNFGQAGVPSLANLGVNAWNGAAPPNAAALSAALGIWGNYANFASLVRNKGKSWVLYRLYIEDLAVSGRSYAAVDALDFAAWQAAFGSGGRFNGDTYTAPSTFP
jgi:hypothetical protein